MVRLSIISRAAGTMPAAMTRDVAVEADSMSGKGARRTSVASGGGGRRTRGLVTMPNIPFGTDHGASQVVAGSADRPPPGPDDIAVRHHHLETEDVVGRNPILEAMRPA